MKIIETNVDIIVALKESSIVSISVKWTPSMPFVKFGPQRALFCVDESTLLLAWVSNSFLDLESLP